LSSSPTCLRTSTSHPSLSIWNRHSRLWWVHRVPTRRTGPLVTQPSKVFHNLSIDSNLWSEIGNTHIFLTKNVCVILKKLVSSFCCKFTNFERRNAIYSHGHREQITALIVGLKGQLGTYHQLFLTASRRYEGGQKLPLTSTMISLLISFFKAPIILLCNTPTECFLLDW
jgi:hypothetical protein